MLQNKNIVVNGPIRSALLKWWGTQNLESAFEWRERLPLWQGLLVEMMLQRTRAQQVQGVFKTLRARYPSARAIGEAPSEDLERLFKPLGLRWRRRLLIAYCRSVGRMEGRLPFDRKSLEQLPGVGTYASSAALSLHGGVRAPILDVNVVRIVCRLRGVAYDGETRRKRWVGELVNHLTPGAGWREFNYAMIDLGRLLCRPKNPRCPECPLRRHCATGRKLICTTQKITDD